jgi:hypothetical protein
MERLSSMTEDGWHVCVNPFRMLGCLLGIGKASDRKLLLFGAASSRRVWDDLSDGERDAIEAAEQYAEGEATWKDLQRIAFAKSGPFHWDKDPLVNFVAAVAATALKKATEYAYGRVWESFKSGSRSLKTLDSQTVALRIPEMPGLKWTAANGKLRKT